METVVMKALLPLLFCLTAIALVSADWPQWRGPDRDDVSKETGLLKRWPTNGPPLLWTFSNAGQGYSGPAIVGDRLYLMGARGDSEFVYALDLNKLENNAPKELWATRVGPTFTWTSNNWNKGPSATPAVDGDLVYALGGMGDLICVESATGKEHWRKNLPTDLGGEVNPIGGGAEKLGWGFTWSPLVDGEQVVCVPGGERGTLAAFNKKTGELIWQSKDLKDQASYSSPLVAEIGGVRQYIVQTVEGASGVAAKDGRLLWSYRRKPAYSDVVIPTPIVHGNYVFMTAGWGAGCDLIEIHPEADQFTVKKVYANKNMTNAQGGVALVGDHVYGYSDNKGWVCMEFMTGKIVWSNRRLRAGSLTCADGHLYCYGEQDGSVVLAQASPEKWTETGKFTIPKESTLRLPSGKIWTHPVVANGRLYLRDQELLFCYDVKDHAQKSP
jgi:outer membrane protein assembly factor BamB